MNKRLIEYDLPLADISEASAREKDIRHGHPSTLQIRWARRPLAIGCYGGADCRQCQQDGGYAGRSRAQHR